MPASIARRRRMRTLITNGTIVTADGSAVADVLVDGETIAAIGRDLVAGGACRRTRRSTRRGKYVIPGAIDVHTHMELPFGGTFAKDTFETGTRAAAFGGTTTIVDFAVQSRGKSLREGLDAWHAKARGQRRRRLRLPHDHERRQRRHRWPRWTSSSPRASPTSSSSPPTRASSTATTGRSSGRCSRPRRTAA